MARPSTLALGSLTMLLIGCASIEVAGFFYLKAMQKKHEYLFHFDIEAHVASVPEEDVNRYVRARERGDLFAPDSDLGWTRVAGASGAFPDGSSMSTDESGSRVAPGATGPVLISTYGDSFTQGLEVNDDETWPAYLGELTNSSVKNFGVMGYGPDQALLALEANLERGLATPIVILAVTDENFERIMNAFRGFYVPDLGLSFKPVFVEAASGYELRNYAPADLRDRAAVTDALRKASEVDPFYRQRTERAAFPFSVHAVGFLMRQGFRPEPTWPGHQKGGKARMTYILERFQRVAVSHGLLPVLALLPHARNEFDWRGGRDHSLMTSILADGDLDGLVFVDVLKALTGDRVDEYAHNFDASRYIRGLHASPYGNRAVAAVLAHSLRDAVRAARGDDRAPTTESGASHNDDEVSTGSPVDG